MKWTDAKSLGFLTLGVFVPAGLLLIAYFRDAAFSEFLAGYWWLPNQIALGVATGIAFGYVAWFVACQRFMAPSLRLFTELIQQLNLSVFEVWFLSICAGVGEELFFRGGLQPIFGIWPTAIIFVAIHGYLNPFDWRNSIYGAVMCLMIAALGYLTESVGIVTAMVAHTMIDVVLLTKLRQKRA